MLSGTIETGDVGAQGFDANTKLTAKSAKALRQAGFRFAIRYLSRLANPPDSDLTASEAEIILKAGLALMAVQHVPSAGWVPTAAKGKDYGTNAVQHAQAIGLPAGLSVFLDLEGVKHDASAEAVIDYCNSWFDVVSAAGYVTGVYVGANAILNGEQLYWRLKTKHYWKSGSTVPDIPVRGYCMTQRIVPGDIVGGVEIDRNALHGDKLGNVPFWLDREGAGLVVAAQATVSGHGLDPAFSAKVDELLSIMKKKGHDFRISQGLRSPQIQADYYCQWDQRSAADIDKEAHKLSQAGAPWLADLLHARRDMPRTPRWLTNALPGAGWHQWGLAADCYCYVNGKMVENGSDPRYKLYADQAQALGLTAGYYFKSQDSGHIQALAAPGATAVHSWAEIDKIMQERFGEKLVALQ